VEEDAPDPVDTSGTALGKSYKIVDVYIHVRSGCLRLFEAGAVGLVLL
jgi:hypothetical protein